MLIAEQNPSPLSKGALPFVDAFYDIRHPFNSSTGGAFSISGFSGALPVTIQNMPEEQAGGVYATGDGSFTLINYGQEKTTGPVTIPGGLATSVFITQDEKYLYAANPATHVISVEDVVNKLSYILNLPNVYQISVNPGGTIVLAFVRNSTQSPGTSSCIASSGYNPQNPGSPQPSCSAPQGQFSAYSIVHLTNAQSTAAANNPNYLGAQDCEPQNLPRFCAFPVSTGSGATFNNPVKAVFSPDGSTAYVLNCGPECGSPSPSGGAAPTPATSASLAVIPITASSLNNSSEGASGINLVAQSNVLVPGGATNAAFNGNTLYVAGQQLQPDGLFAGNLTVVNTGVTPLQLTGTYSISDGTHNKMVFADNNTLWIGSVQCQLGERYKQVQAGANVPYGCMTMFNTANNSVLLESYKGDGTGVTAVTGLNKVYTAEGGQVYIYNTTDGSARDNSNVTVTGTAADVAYMDAPSDADNTTY